MTDESELRALIARIDAAWRKKQFDGLEACFHEQARIVGPGDVEYASGRQDCAHSYIEFASNAAVLAYSESTHALHIWESVAVYTFSWEMEYQRDNGPKLETGTDQLVFQRGPTAWQLVCRTLYFAPS